MAASVQPLGRLPALDGASMSDLQLLCFFFSLCLCASFLHLLCVFRSFLLFGLFLLLLFLLLLLWGPFPLWKSLLLVSGYIL